MKPGELYVYYKLRPEDGPTARAAFEAARGSAPIRLMQRVDEGQLLTWMEIYTASDTAFEPVIARAMQAFAQGGRHVESFAPLS